MAQQINMDQLKAAVLDALYPVGSIYVNASVSTNPGTLLGFGTWAAFGSGRTMVGLDSGQTEFDTLEETGGAKTVTLTSAQSGLPAHQHGLVDGQNFGIANTTTTTAAGSRWNLSDPPGTYKTQMNVAADAASAHNNLQPYIVVYMWKRTA